MTDDLHTATRQLIHEVESKDKKFRIAQVLFNILVLLLLVIAMSYGYNTLKMQQTHRDQAVQKIIQELDNRVGEQSNQIQCIVDFFSQPNRTDLVITDPDKCFTKQVSDSSAPPTQSSSPAPQTQTTSQSPLNKNNSTSGQGNQVEPHPLICIITLKLLGCS